PQKVSARTQVPAAKTVWTPRGPVAPTAIEEKTWVITQSGLSPVHPVQTPTQPVGVPSGSDQSWTAEAKPIRVSVPTGINLQEISFNANGRSTAVINKQTVSVGERVAGCTVTAIQKQFVAVTTATGMKHVLPVGDLWHPQAG